MKVLLASPAYVARPYREKLIALAAQPEVDLCLLVPRSWKHPLGEARFEPTPEDACYRSIPVPVHLSGSNGRFMFPWIALFEILKREKPDILHIETDLLCLSAFQLILLNRLATRARTVFFSWENLYHRHRPIRRFVEHQSIHNADHLIAGNREAKDVLMRKGIPSGRISIMPQIGVTPGTTRAGYPHHPPGPFTIGFVGRLIEEKGVFTLLEAFAALPSDCRLLMVGDGSALGAFTGRAGKLGVTSRVELAGSVPFHNVESYLRRMDVLVLPSLTTRLWAEQFGHVLVEAMVLGIPVVGSDSGAIPEVIGDAGMVFPEGDAPALTEQLRKLADSAALRLDLSARGQDRCRRLYTHTRIAEQTARIYTSLLRGCGK